MGRPSKPEGTRIRDIAPTGVRLAPDLRDHLVREAKINNRTLSQEVIHRLQWSRDRDTAPFAATRGELREPHAPSAFGPAPLGDDQRTLLALFKTLAPEKQLALLTLLRR